MEIYAVRKGNKTGIFDSWSECRKAVGNFENPDFKKFTIKEEAEEYLNYHDPWSRQIEEDNNNGYLVAFTGGYFDKIKKIYLYGIQFVFSGGNEKGICGNENSQEYIDNDAIGEIFGIINVLDWALVQNYKKVKIYYRHEEVSRWIAGEWNVKLKIENKLKYKEILKIEFIKVSVNDVFYSKKADYLAKLLVRDWIYTKKNGDSCFWIFCFEKYSFVEFAQHIKEINGSVSYTENSSFGKKIYEFELQGESATVTLYTGDQILFVKGKINHLFQIIVMAIIELYDDDSVANILKEAYNVRGIIDNKKIKEIDSSIEKFVPNGYPNGIKRLLKEAMMNTIIFNRCVDYSMYVFPALRALEGHIKYLITEAGGRAGRQFGCFGLDKNVNPNRYVVTANFPDNSKNKSIENCYNYYKSQRDTIFHFGDILGEFDNTRFIENKDEADEIIKKCIELISSEQ